MHNKEPEPIGESIWNTYRSMAYLVPEITRELTTTEATQVASYEGDRDPTTKRTSMSNIYERPGGKKTVVTYTKPTSTIVNTPKILKANKREDAVRRHFDSDKMAINYATRTISRKGK